jgi:hypothetical protein
MLLYDKKFGLNGEKDGAKEEGRKVGQRKNEVALRARCF